MSTTTKTVMVTDVRGSTDLRVRIGDDAFDDLRRAHDRLLGDIAQSHGGEVVKGSGDGLIVLFDSAHSALDAAVAMQVALDRAGTRLGERLGVGIGVSAGDVAVESDDCHGLPVVEAARLCGVAAADEVLVADVVRVLAGSRTTVPLVSRGALELKGLPSPLVAFAAVWEPSAPVVPFPVALSGGAFPFAGRSAALGRLRAVWDQAVAGTAQLVLLSGEPGIGKTRTAGEFAQRVHDEGAVVLFGRCDEDLSIPFQPFVEPLLQLLRLDDELLQRQRVVHRSILGRLGDSFVAVTGPPPPSDSTDVDRQRLFDAAADLLRSASESTPIVLVLDDLHWATVPTLGLLRHVLRTNSSSSLMLIATYRDTDLDRRHPLAAALADLRREGSVERIALAGLDADEVFRFVEQAAGQDLDETGHALSAAVSAETGGNPFFVSEVLRDLAESGAISFEGERWVATLPVERLGLPEGVREVVGRRLSRLSDSANRVLAVAAVAGPRFEVGVLERVHAPAVEVLEALEAAAAAGLVAEDASGVGVFGFTHALVRQTLLSELTATRRARVHQSIAQAIEQQHAQAIDAYVPDLAVHYGAAAALGEWDRAIDYARRAVEQAGDRLAWEESFRWLDRALELDELDPVDSRPRRIGLLRLAEQRRFVNGDRDGARRATLEWAEVAHSIGDHVAHAEAIQRAVRVIPFAMPDPEIDALVERALGHAPVGSTQRARLLMALAGSSSVNARGRDSRALAEEAVAIAEESGDPELINGAMTVLAMSLASGPDAQRELAVAERALAAAVAVSGDPFLTATGHHRTCFALLRVADLDGFRRARRNLLHVATEQLWSPIHAAGAHQLEALHTMLVGPLADAEQQITAVLEFSGAEPMYLAGSAAQLAWLRQLEHRYEESEAIVERLIEASPEGLRASLQLSTAALLADAGDRRRAAAIAAEIEGGPFALLESDWSRSSRLHDMATLAAALEDADLGAAVAQELRPYDGQLLVGFCTHVPASAAHALGLTAIATGERDAARSYFDAALELETRIGAHVLAERTRRRIASID